MISVESQVKQKKNKQKKTRHSSILFVFNFGTFSSSSAVDWGGLLCSLARRHNHGETDAFETCLQLWRPNYTMPSHCHLCVSGGSQRSFIIQVCSRSSAVYLFTFEGMSPAAAFGAISRARLNDWPNPNLGRSAKNSAMPRECTSAGSSNKANLSCGVYVESLAFLCM